jgi:predicted O-methyltransferase YrrM
MSGGPNVFKRYPRLINLKGLVPEEVIERDIAKKGDIYKKYDVLARHRIPTVNLCEVFPRHLERGRIVLENFLGQWGNISIEELCKISLIVSYFRPETIFEFGTYNGCTTLQMAMNAPNACRVYTLDIRPEEVGGTLFDVGEIGRYLAGKTDAFNFEIGHYFKGTPFELSIIQLWGESAKFDFSTFWEKIDLIFVDAAHTYEYVKSDSENAFRMLRKGGVIIWHDYMQMLHPDVTRYLYEISAQKAIHHIRGTNLALYCDGKGEQ